FAPADGLAEPGRRGQGHHHGRHRPRPEGPAEHRGRTGRAHRRGRGCLGSYVRGGSGGSSPRASTAGGSGGSSPRASTAGGSGGSSPRASTAGVPGGRPPGTAPLGQLATVDRGTRVRPNATR